MKTTYSVQKATPNCIDWTRNQAADSQFWDIKELRLLMMRPLLLELRQCACGPNINITLLAFSVHHSLRFSPFFLSLAIILLLLRMVCTFQNPIAKKTMTRMSHTNSFYVDYKYVLYILLILVNYMLWLQVKPYHDWFWPKPPHPSSPWYNIELPVHIISVST